MYDKDGDTFGFTLARTEYYYVKNVQNDAIAIADSETGFYFLQSRYYDPETGRFISSDGYLSTGQDILGNNMFAYCENNPVNYFDPIGQWKLWNKFKTKVKKFLNDFISDYNLESNDIVAVTSSAAIVTNKNIDIGKGWKARLDTADQNSKTQTHIHVEKGNLKYSQNEDGSKHDGHSTKGSPPNSVKKKIKKQLGWDWDGNLQKFQSEHGIDFTDDPIYQFFFSPTDIGGYGSLFATEPSTPIFFQKYLHLAGDFKKGIIYEIYRYTNK